MLKLVWLLLYLYKKLHWNANKYNSMGEPTVYLDIRATRVPLGAHF